MTLSAFTFHPLPDKARLRYASVDMGASARGCVLIAPGRREFIEKKYAELGPELSRHGMNQIYFEWRGQGLSTRYLEGAERQRDYALTFTQHLEDLRHFFRTVVLPPLKTPLFTHGHSLGGHLMLRWLAEDRPKEISGAFLTAPMLAIGPRLAHNVSRPICWMMVKAGKDKEYAPLQHDYGGLDREFKGNPLTQDEKRYRIIQDYFDAQPDLKVGGVTWGWLAAAIASMSQCRDPDYLARINVPVLCLTGSKDIVTPANEIRRYLKFIPKIENIVISGSRHDVLNEMDVYRNEAWQHIGRFIG